MNYDADLNCAIMGNPEGNFTKIEINDFKGKKYLDIRKMWNNNGEVLPTKKGISVAIEDVNELISLIKMVVEKNE